MNEIYLVFALLAVWYGAHIVVDHALIIAKQLKVSKLFMGLTILSLGTTLPEIFTHINASLAEKSGQIASNIAIGANIGSNIFETTLMIGILGLFTTIKSSKNIQNRDGIILLLTAILLFLLGLDGVISRSDGIILILVYLIYLFYLYTREEKLEDIISRKSKLTHRQFNNFLHHSFLIAIGLFILQFAAESVILNTISLSSKYGIDQSFIGSILIGFSSALPEFTVACIGLLKKSRDISLGVIFGSNITNPTIAVGIGALIYDNPISRSLLFFDLPYMFLIIVILLILFKEDHKFGKKEGILMITFYILYVLYKSKVYGVI